MKGKTWRAAMLRTSALSPTNPKHHAFILPDYPSWRNRPDAEACHRSVLEDCKHKTTDGYGLCVMYAVTGYALLADQGFQIQVGAMQLVGDPTASQHVTFGGIDADWGSGKYHAWLARPNGSKIEIVDFTARHYRQYVDQGGGHWNRPDAPTWIWNTTGDQLELVQFRCEHALTRNAWAYINDAPDLAQIAAIAQRQYRELLSQAA